MTARDAGRYRARHLLLPSGWVSPGYFEVDAAGLLGVVAAELPAGWPSCGLKALHGYVVPGMPNVHSHAHQRGLVGRAERLSGVPGGDNLWSWRARMYEFVLDLLPDQLEAIAAQSYVEMVKAGFTSVGEFHYLHHDRNGAEYADVTEMSGRILASADRVGIALSLLPVLYTHGGIGKALAPEQRRFAFESVDAFAGLVERLAEWRRDRPLLNLGVAPHSLRAVSAENLAEVTAFAARLEVPVHIHIAEQSREVDECVSRLGARPIEWLLDNVEVDAGWTFVHATHCDAAERTRMATTGVVAGLCPVTEANLGDGLFPLHEYHRDSGAWAIGSDSNSAISVVEELRVLEYGQRLALERRDVLTAGDDDATGSPGRVLFGSAVAGGARALSQPAGSIESGRRADLVELDEDDSALLGQEPASALDAWIFSGTGHVVRSVMVGGSWVVRDGHHEAEDLIARAFRATMEAVWSRAVRT